MQLLSPNTIDQSNACSLTSANTATLPFGVILRSQLAGNTLQPEVTLPPLMVEFQVCVRAYVYPCVQVCVCVCMGVCMSECMCE